MDSWTAPGRPGAVAFSARPGEILVAGAWSSARLPRAEVWWVRDGAVVRHCLWEAPPTGAQNFGPRGAADLLAVGDGAVVAGVDGSLVEFDHACVATLHHTAECCEDERSLSLQPGAPWVASDGTGSPVTPTSAPTQCVPKVDGGTLATTNWRATVPGEISALLDWTADCGQVLVGSGTHAFRCAAGSCTAVR